MGAAVPAMGVASSVMGMMQQGQQMRAANRANARAGQLTDQQIGLINDYVRPIMEQQKGAYGRLAPGMVDLGEQAISLGRRYDPAAETEAATRAFDSAASESLSRDMSNTRLPLQLRGLAGTSEDGAQTSGLLARRARARGQFVGDLRASESQRALQYKGAAAGVGSPLLQQFNPAATAQGAAGVLGGAAQTNMNMGQQNYANAMGMNPFASLQGLNWDWLRSRSGGGSGSGRRPGSSGY